MDLGLRDKVIVVTGGTRGIGEGILRVLSDEKVIVCNISRDEDDNLELKKSLSEAGIHFVKVESADPGSCESAVRSVVQAFGRIDGLVNNAADNEHGGMETSDYDKFLHSLHSNLLPGYLMTHFALPYLKESRGTIVNISTMGAETLQRHTSSGGAVPGGQNALTREWAVELLKYGIRVNSVTVLASRMIPFESPPQGALENPGKNPDEYHYPLPFENLLTTPFEIAHAVAFLLSEKSSHTTGQLFRVNGGSRTLTGS